MKSYSLVVFDWDGTLMDSTHSISLAIQGACRDLELPVPTAAQAAWVIGLSLDQALRKAVPQLTKAMEPFFLERYRYHYLGKDKALKLFDGVIDMLDALASQGATLAVATGKSRVGLNRALTTTDLHKRFAATRCAGETFGKPHPGMLLELMDELMVSPDRVVMVGDTSHDLLMAANAGVHGVGVAYGAHPHEELLKSPHHAIAKDVSQLSAWLLERAGSD
jgi:phosphoglycolate phosphatase